HWASEALVRLIEDKQINVKKAGYPKAVDRANLFLTIALGFKQVGDTREANNAYALAQKAVEECGPPMEASREVASGLGFALPMMGQFQYESGNPNEALRSYRQTWELADDLARRGVADEIIKSHLAQSAFWTGKLEDERDHSTEALRAYQRAAEVYEELVRIR